MTDYYGDMDRHYHRAKHDIEYHEASLHPADRPAYYDLIGEFARQKKKEHEDQNERIGVPERQPGE